MNTLVIEEIKEVNQDYNTLKNLGIHKKALMKKIRMWKDKLIDEVIKMYEISPKWIGQEIVKIKKDAYYADKEKMFVIIKNNDITIKGIYQGIKNTSIVNIIGNTKATYNLAKYSFYGKKEVFDKIYHPLPIEIFLEDYSNELKSEFIILMEEAKTFNINF